MKNAPVGPIGWRGRVSVRAAGLCGSQANPGRGFRCWQAAWARAKALWNTRLCSWSVCGEERCCSSCKKRKKHPVAIPGCAELPAVQLVPPGRLLIGWGVPGRRDGFLHIVGHAAFLHLKTAGLKPQKGIGRPRLMVQRQAAGAGIEKQRPAHFHGVLEVAVAVKVDRGIHALENLWEMGQLQKALPHILGHFLVGRVPGGEALIQFPGSRTFPAALPHAHGRDVLQEQAAHPIGRGEASGLRQAPHPGKGPLPHGFPRSGTAPRIAPGGGAPGVKYPGTTPGSLTQTRRFPGWPAFPGPPG